MVTMWRASRRLISSTRAASVVVLPEPVGPPTRTSPRGSRVRPSTPGGRPREARRGGCDGRARTAAAARPRSRWRLIAEAAEPRMRYERIGDPALAVGARGAPREHRQHRLLDLVARERRLGEREEAAVDSNGRRRSGDEQQIAPFFSTSTASQRLRRGESSRTSSARASVADGLERLRRSGRRWRGARAGRR